MVRTLEAGVRCPVCLGIGKFIHGKNDLVTVCPEIASEWHDEKNGTYPQGMSRCSAIIMHGGNARNGMSGRQRLRQGQNRTAGAAIVQGIILSQGRMTL